MRVIPAGNQVESETVAKLAGTTGQSAGQVD